MKNMNKKGQVVLEFIMQYGWAILIVIIIIAAIGFFGINLPEKQFDNGKAGREVCANLEAFIDDNTIGYYPGLREPLKMLNEQIEGTTDKTPLIRFSSFPYESTYTKGAIDVSKEGKDALTAYCSIPTLACYQFPEYMDFEWCTNSELKIGIKYTDWEEWISDKKRLS